MSTQAQVAANQANAQHSTGPRTEAGKAASSRNNVRHGLTGPFLLLSSESQVEFDNLYHDLRRDHAPCSRTEDILVEQMAQSHWLRQRAITFQTLCFSEVTGEVDQKELALYLRYQTTHDRAFYKALNELLRLKEQRRKEEIGFVSQKRREAQDAAQETQRKAHESRREAHELRCQAAENRANELHQARVWLTEAQARRHETETTIAELMKMPRKAQPNSEQALQNAA